MQVSTLPRRAYCGDYLRLEVQAEGLVRGIEPYLTIPEYV